MYFPILRGRQFELLALRECVNNGILSDFLIPIVEPVKVSSTFTKTLDSFVDHKHPIGVIRNPVVGKWSREIVKTSNQKIQKHYTELLDNKYLIETFYVTPDLGSNGVLWENRILQFEKSILICNQPEYVEHYEHITSGISPLYNIIPTQNFSQQTIFIIKRMDTRDFQIILLLVLNIVKQALLHMRWQFTLSILMIIINFASLTLFQTLMMIFLIQQENLEKL